MRLQTQVACDAHPGHALRMSQKKTQTSRATGLTDAFTSNIRQSGPSAGVLSSAPPVLRTVHRSIPLTVFRSPFRHLLARNLVDSSVPITIAHDSHVNLRPSTKACRATSPVEQSIQGTGVGDEDAPVAIPLPHQNFARIIKKPVPSDVDILGTQSRCTRLRRPSCQRRR